MESPHSPEAEIGYRVEDLWDIQEPQLSPSEKLNSCFENITVSSFPPAHPSQVIEIPSDSSLAETVETLSKHKILSAPVRNVEAPEDASWIDRYIGIVEFAGIAVWLLHQSEVAALKMMAGSAATGLTAGGVAATLGALTLGTTTSGVGGIALASAAATGATVAAGPAKSGPDAAASMGGSFFESLTSSDFYKNTKVGDISGSFRWAPFLALQKSDSFLTMLLLLSKYRMKSLPVVDLGEGKIENIITQSSVVHMLAECAGLPWFESWGTKKLFELGLPIMKPDRLVKVGEEEPVMRAFQLMRKKGIGGLPVVNESGKKAVGNISIRDVQYLLTAPDIYKDYRHLYELDQHLDRFLRSASMAKINLPFDCSTIRSILIQNVIASKCTQGSLRYWLSSGPGDSLLSPSGSPNPALYAVVIQTTSLPEFKGTRVITSSIPMKSPQFAIMKSVNYLPNVLSKMEAEENDAFAAIWLDDEGYVAEGPNMNVGFVTKERELVVPKFDKILSGCTSKRVLVLAERLVKEGRIKGIDVRDVTVHEGKLADEMMLIGSGILVKPVLQWDDHFIGDGKEGPVTEALFNMIVEDMKAGPSTVRIPIPY